MKIAILHGGDQIAFDGETDEGILSDAGLIEWHWVAAFLCYHEPTRRWMTVPLDD